jgi:hypothetical protein
LSGVIRIKIYDFLNSDSFFIFFQEYFLALDLNMKYSIKWDKAVDFIDNQIERIQSLKNFLQVTVINTTKIFLNFNVKCLKYFVLNYVIDYFE